MNKLRIYYCIDINLWYVDKDDGLIRDTQNPQETFNTYDEALNFFVKHFDKYLSLQKEMVMDAGQYHWSEKNICSFETINYYYEINCDGILKSKSKTK